MIKKEVFIGFLVGLAANLTGIFFYTYFFSDYPVEEAVALGIQEGVLGSLIALGAIMNFLPFFVFLKKNQIYRVRGVLMATLLAAIAIMISEIMSF